MLRPFFVPTRRSFMFDFEVRRKFFFDADFGEVVVRACVFRAPVFRVTRRLVEARAVVFRDAGLRA